jgi:hypothetical protein
MRQVPVKLTTEENLYTPVPFFFLFNKILIYT